MKVLPFSRKNEGILPILRGELCNLFLMRNHREFNIQSLEFNLNTFFLFWGVKIKCLLEVKQEIPEIHEQTLCTEHEIT